MKIQGRLAKRQIKSYRSFLERLVPSCQNVVPQIKNLENRKCFIWLFELGREAGAYTMEIFIFPTPGIQRGP
jgi:hypothetical protein